jgi:hypothetical protein
MSEETKTDDGTALALYFELSAYFDPKLTEHDKRIVLDKIKYRTSNTLIEEQAARIAEAEKDYHEERKARYAAQSELVASQARLSEAVKVLEEATKGLDMVHNGLMDPTRPRQAVGEVCHHFLSKAKAFITTLGGEK